MSAPPSTDRRRAGRVAAVQLLFQLDRTGGLRAEEVEVTAALHFASLDPDAEEEVRELATRLCRGTVEEIEEIDRLLEQASTNWRLERMSRLDRAVLRLAAHELRSRPEVPAPVVLDEAIEIAREFGATESSAFVNGVLDRVLRLVGR